MRKHAISVLVILVTLVSVLQSGLTSGQAAQDQQSPAVSLVIQSGAQAAIRRTGWSGFSRLSLGAEVQFGDLIDPKGEPVRILCANLVVQVMTRLGPLPCPRERIVLHQGAQALAAWQRGKAEDTSIPFLISPRATAIATPYPVIWWNPVSDADGYRVTVRGEGVNWTAKVDDPKADQLTYPKDAPPLKPGVPYTVEIVTRSFGADGRSSTEEDVPGLSFTLLTAQEVNDVQKAVAGIRANIRDKTVSDLAVAYYYAQRGLKAEALQFLANLSRDLPVSRIPSGAQPATPLSASPVLYLRLGDLFTASRIGLYAASAYRRAVALAEKSGDLESQAIGWMELARLAIDPSQRTEYATTALAMWRQLGAQSQIEAVQKEFSLDSN